MSTLTTRAAVLRTPGGSLSVENFILKEPRPDEVVVRIVAASICHSDVHVINNGAPHLPMIIGHEAAGIVERRGENVNDLVVGDKVALSFVPSCGNCRPCNKGLRIACERGSGIGGDGRSLNGRFNATDADGVEVGQMVRLGAWSERTLVHRDSLVKLPANADLIAAAVISCGFVTGAGAAINEGETRPGDAVVVVGTGGVGIAAIQGAVVAGAATVIAVDVNDAKLAKAVEFGATHTINAAENADWPSEVKKINNGLGVDVGISCVGTLTDDNVAQILSAVADAGRAILVGAGRANVDLFEMGRKTLVRSLYGSHDPKADQMRYYEMFKAGRFKVREMVTKTYELDDVNNAVADITSGVNLRGVMILDQNANLEGWH